MAEQEHQAPVDPPESDVPTVIVSGLDVKYTVYGGERRGNPSSQGEPTSFREMLKARRTVEKTREVHAVRGVSFVTYHGESVGIIGRNGSGKSTLLRAVAGLIPPSAGRIWVSGEPSLLGVNAVLKRKLSGERNIYIGAQALGLSKAEIAQRFDDIVEFSGIGDAVYLPMSTYSSGMGARLRFAISTAAAPDVLMIDEALATGDADFRAKSAERITQIREEAGTVFLVSHSNSTIRQICDRVLWMDKGELIMDGPTEEVLKAYEATLPKKKGPQKKPAAKDPQVPGTTRWTGDNRFVVASEIIARTWEPGVEGCFVVSINRMAAARAIAPVAARLGWPLMWVRPGAVPNSTRTQLSRLRPRRVVVVGGEELVGTEVEGVLEEATGVAAERIGHDDFTLTSAQILRDFPPPDTSTVHITHGDSSGRSVFSLPPAVSGQAVVICEDDLPEELSGALAALRPARLLFHGTEEEWAPETVRALRAATGAEIEFSPRGGPLVLAAGLWDDVEPGGEVIVSGRAAVEMLSAIVAARYRGSPLMFFSPERVPPQVDAALTRLRPREIVLAGTMDALPPKVRRGLGKFVLTPDPEPAATQAAEASSVPPDPTPR